MKLLSGLPKAGVPASVPLSAPAGTASRMTCEECGLEGGPFTAAEAAYFRAVHDRLFHGVVSAA